MLQRFIWIFITILTLCYSVYPDNEIIGDLKIWLKYENRLGVKTYAKCNLYYDFCDLYLKICLTEYGSSKPCTIGMEITPKYYVVQGYKYHTRYNYTSNKKMNLNIEVLDADSKYVGSKVGIFRHSFMPSSAYPELEVEAMERLYGHYSTNMSLKIRGRCMPHHYGSECKYCRSTKRGYCDSNGILACLPGYYGPYCSKFDGCRSLKCAPFATCAKVGNDFVCYCDNTFGKRCEEGYDPCAEHLCRHGGTCVPIGEHLNFAKCVNCSERWSGPHCDEELDACEYEASKLGHPPCSNGGHCIVDTNDKTQFVCLCAFGWQGSHCETSFAIALFHTPLIWICILIFFFTSITLLYFCIRFCVIPKLKCRRERSYSSDLVETRNAIDKTKYDRVSNHVIIWRRRDPTIEEPLPSDTSSYSDIYDRYETVDGIEEEEYEASTIAESRLNPIEPLTLAPPISNYEHAKGNISDSISVDVRNRPLPSTPKEDGNN